jgi:RNA polymerase sigma factor (sigma-70 family)
MTGDPPRPAPRTPSSPDSISADDSARLVPSATSAAGPPSAQGDQSAVAAANTNPSAAALAKVDVASTFALLELAKAGDRDALEAVLARYIPALQRWARGRLPRWARDVRDTDDLVQDTVFQTLRHLNAFEPRREGALHAYLRQAVANRIRDEVRRAHRRPMLGELDGEHEAGDASPLDEVVGREAHERYEAALARLRPEEREAIVARVEMGLSFEDVAAALGKPTADAARKTVTRALVRLAEEMRSA